MQDPKKLRVFAASHGLAVEISRLVLRFPDCERFGLASQMRRAAQSIPMNIAEGCKRAYPADKARFINIAEGSAGELEYQLLLACDLGYIAKELHERLTRTVVEVGRMLHGFRKAVLNGRDPLVTSE